MSATSLVFYSWLSLLFAASSTTISNVLNVVRHVESKKKTFMSTTTTAAIHILVEENYNWSCTSSCRRPPLSSPSCRPCCPQWRRPPNKMRNYKTIKTWLDSPTAVWVLSFFFISLIHVFFDRGGKVVSFEMGPPFQMLDINKRYLTKFIVFIGPR